ncbi:YIP1 family protein [Amylibacter sp. SFDW26]|uniref:Yip1 family protein n=1 Tax=Amylibacter sp. SFDW26 TaxID=2652722 RepID=UPI0012621B72|nr:Yip1 family protein [Amylibacter sp. SFDW26]KAB7615931.1 YIP1 family protein [Amylibacter sp. SFDW26]
MQLNTASDWIKLAAETLIEPKKSVRVVLSIGITTQQLVLTAAFVIVISMIPSTLMLLMQPIEVQEQYNEIFPGPLTIFSVHFGFLFFASFLMTAIGRFFGGHGTFNDALSAIVWLQFILFLLQVVQLITAVISAPLFILAGLISFIILMYLLFNFISEVHGFTSIMSVVFGTMAVIMGLLIVLPPLLAALGVPTEIYEIKAAQDV